METVIIVGHILIALAIIGLILMQQGKGADVGASFGSGSSQTLFGGRGAGNALSRGTAILATLFFVSSVALAVMVKHKAESAGLVDLPVPAQQQAPAAPQPEAPKSDLPPAN